MTDFITYGEAIRVFGLLKTWRVMRQALGITRPLVPWNAPLRKSRRPARRRK